MIKSFESQNVNCKLPLDWGIKLHLSLKKLSKCCNDYSKLRKELINLEFCDNCSTYSLKCIINSNGTLICSDILHVLSSLSLHFQHIRTLQRLLYEIRSINIWLFELEYLLKKGSYTQIKSFISTTPVQVKQIIN